MADNLTTGILKALRSQGLATHPWDRQNTSAKRQEQWKKPVHPNRSPSHVTWRLTTSSDIFKNATRRMGLREMLGEISRNHGQTNMVSYRFSPGSYTIYILGFFHLKAQPIFQHPQTFDAIYSLFCRVVPPLWRAFSSYWLQPLISPCHVVYPLCRSYKRLW